MASFEEITFDNFCIARHNLLVADNCALHVLGNIDEGCLADCFDGLPASFTDAPCPTWIAVPPDPYLRRDGHLMRKGAHRAEISALSLCTDNAQAAPEEKLLCLDIAAACGDLGKYQVVADRFDAGILCQGAQGFGLRDGLALPEQPAYQAARNRVVARYVGLLNRNAAAWCAQSLCFHLMNMSLRQYVTWVESCTYQDFCDIANQIAPFFHECQVVIDPEVDRG